VAVFLQKKTHRDLARKYCAMMLLDHIEEHSSMKGFKAGFDHKESTVNQVWPLGNDAALACPSARPGAAIAYGVDKGLTAVATQRGYSTGNRQSGRSIRALPRFLACWRKARPATKISGAALITQNLDPHP
jgi:hypothetical protein